MNERAELVLELHKQGKTTRCIATELHISRNTIRSIYKANNIITKPRKYIIDETFLNQIDSEEKAYFLGWMWSDGGVNDRDDCFAIDLQGTDGLILEKISRFFSNQPMVKYYKDSRYRCGYYARLTIYSKILKQRLIELGCMPRKTFVIKYPDFLTDDLHRHFVRGELEGDGCIEIDRGRSCITILGTYDLLNGINEVLERQTGITGKLKDLENIYSLKIQSYNRVNKFLNWVYLDCNIYLDRKHQEYLKYLEELKVAGKRLVLPVKKTYDLSTIKDLFDQNMGARKIATQLKMTRWAVQQAYKELGIYNIGRKLPRTVYLIKEKVCKKCSEMKLIDQFRKRQSGTRIGFESLCLFCEKEYNKQKYQKTKLLKL